MWFRSIIIAKKTLKNLTINSFIYNFAVFKRIQMNDLAFLFEQMKLFREDLKTRFLYGIIGIFGDIYLCIIKLPSHIIYIYRASSLNCQQISFDMIFVFIDIFILGKNRFVRTCPLFGFPVDAVHCRKTDKGTKQTDCKKIHAV